MLCVSAVLLLSDTAEKALYKRKQALRAKVDEVDTDTVSY